ncbi:hypothetical protein BYT27DRAFT_7207386 [Phlegmacium glaucopus]|nr:hypothetical protein BYT27DRAFT_7207386 [Phlegmacium glaucopus]
MLVDVEDNRSNSIGQEKRAIGLLAGYSVVRENVDIQFSEEKAVNTFLNHPGVQTTLVDLPSNAKRLVSDVGHLMGWLFRLADDLRVEVKEFGRDRRRVVDTPQSNRECVLLGVLWAHKLFDQLFQTQAKKIEDKNYAEIHFHKASSSEARPGRYYASPTEV